MEKRPFPCELVSNYDGDTFELDIDLGFETTLRAAVRLGGIDTPELRGGTALTKDLAVLARDEAERFIREGRELVFQCEEWAGKYGRPVGDLEVDGVSLKGWLIEQGLGVPYEGGSRRKLKYVHMENAQRALDAGRFEAS